MLLALIATGGVIVGSLALSPNARAISPTPPHIDAGVGWSGSSCINLTAVNYKATGKTTYPLVSGRYCDQDGPDHDGMYYAGQQYIATKGQTIGLDPWESSVSEGEFLGCATMVNGTLKKTDSIQDDDDVNCMMVL